MNNTVNFRPSNQSFTHNQRAIPKRIPESINIVGPTKNQRNRIDVRFDDTTVSFPKKTTLEDLLKSIDKLMNTYVRGSKPVKPASGYLKMYG